MGYEAVLHCAFLGLSFLAVGRRLHGARWLSIPLLAVLMTPVTFFFIEALLRDPENHGRFFYMWPFPYPNVGLNALFWLVVWGIAAFFWIPRPPPPQPLR
jgi:hypothetical protein